MARESKDDRLQRIHAEIMEDFDVDYSAVSTERDLCVEDRRFATIPGAQWEGALAEQFENKPRFEVNKVHLSVLRIINDYRANRITTDFVPKDGKKADKLADTLDGLYRADEQDSVADEAYDNAFEEAATGGFGAYRLKTVYEDEDDEDNEHQRIRIEPIYDADSCVFFDANAKRQDKSDAKRVTVLSAISRDAYKREYGEDPSEWQAPEVRSAFDWAPSDSIYIGEAYRIEQTTKTIQVWRNILGEEEKYPSEAFEEEGFEAHLTAIGSRLESVRKIKTNRVHKYLVNGNKVIEDCGFIAGKRLPVVPVYGKRWMIGGIERCMGHVRLAKDAQRLGNMQRSKIGEIAAMSSVSKPIFHPQQIAGHEYLWANDNVNNYPFQLVNEMTDASGAPVPGGPLGYTKPPEIPPALAALLQISESDLRDVLGNTEQMDATAQNMSGVAVELIQNRVDAQSFIFTSNFAKAMKCGGEIWLSMAQEIYAEEGREMKTIAPDGSVGSVEIGRKIEGEEGAIETENDIANAKMAVSVSIGPTSQSSKAATVRALTSMMTATADPETKAILGSMIMLNMEGEGISDVRAFFRKRLLRAQVITPTPEEAQELAQEAQQQGPSAQDQYLQAAAQEASANAQRSQADTVLKVAQAQNTKVKTAQVAADIQQALNEQALTVLEKFTPEVPRAPEVSVVRVANPQTPTPRIGPATE